MVSFTTLILVTSSLQLIKCCYEKQFTYTIQEPSPYYYNSYTTKTIVRNSTIICSNLTSLNDIVYNYENHVYEQFLSVTLSNISTVGPLAFAKFSTITKLYLDHIQVRIVLPGAFSGLTALRELYLNDNELTEVSNGLYNSLHRLEILNLTNNKIFRIDNFGFMGMAKLSELYLKNNNISVIEDGTFESLNGLKRLDVSQNPLEKFPFGDLSNIEILTLAETALDAISDDLSNLTIKVLTMSKSQVSIGTIDFSYFPKLDTLDLSSDKIESLENCQNLDVASVSLDNNEIESINKFYKVSRLSAKANRIQVLEPFLINPKLLVFLDFSYNHISKIDTAAFQNLTALVNLTLQNNNIHRIDPVLFRDLTNLESLDVSQNQIKDFQYGTFDTLTNLRILNISSNKLLELHQYTFNSLSKLIYLYFDNNQISSFNARDLRRHLPILSVVSLDHNPWNCRDLVEIEQEFKNLTITIPEGFSYDVENFHGIACSNAKNFDTSVKNSSISFKNLAKNFQNAVNDGISNSKMESFLNDDFEKSKFVQYFAKDYSESNFFKYLDNYKFSVVKQEGSNSSKADKLTALELKANDPNYYSVAVFGVVLLVIMSVLSLFNVYFLFSLLKAKKLKNTSDNSSQMELC